jgi:hypothetical protein
MWNVTPVIQKEKGGGERKVRKGGEDYYWFDFRFC